MAVRGAALVGRYDSSARRIMVRVNEIRVLEGSSAAAISEQPITLADPVVAFGGFRFAPQSHATASHCRCPFASETHSISDTA